MQRLRIATVPYVNAAPLVWGLREAARAGACDLRAERPSGIPDLLRRGEADAGLVPIVALPDLPEVEILPGLSIASRRRAGSVLVVSKGPLREARRIALDASSRTSAALLKVLLAAEGRRDLLFTESETPLSALLEGHDAALVIGDPALQADTRGLEVLDLGEAWFEATGLPFVFAAWAVRRDAPLADGGRLFHESYRLGSARLDAIASEWGPRLDLNPEVVAEYLRTNIHHDLGVPEIAGAERFLARAHALGLAGPLARLPFRGPEAAPGPLAALPEEARA